MKHASAPSAAATLPEWSHSNAENNPIDTDPADAYYHRMFGSSDGGYLFSWVEDRDWVDSLKSLDLTIDGPAVGGFGESITNAGDLNGDGYYDFVVGAPHNATNGTDAGAVYVFFGGPGLDNTPDLTILGAAAGDQFGFSLTGGNDFNGDGSRDFAVGAPYNNGGGADAGRVYVFFGGVTLDASADLVLTGGAAGDRFGYSMSGAYPGYSTYIPVIVVGAPGCDSAGTDAGRAYLFQGGGSPDTVPDLVFDGEATGDNFGHSVLTLRTNNNDFIDIAIGAPFNAANGTDAGRVYLYLQSVGADTTAEMVFTGEAPGDRFGSTLALYRYSYDELLVGAPFSDAAGADAGAVYYFSTGSSGPLDATADAVYLGEATDDHFGSSICGGHQHGVVIGAPQNDAGGADAGRVYWYFAPNQLDPTPDFTVTGEAAGDRLGSSVTMTWDVTADGMDDLLITAPFYDAVSSDVGRIYAYSGGNGTKIYGQKVGPDGDLLWGSGGKILADLTRNVYETRFVDDGAGGAYIAWFGITHFYTTSNGDLYVSRIDADGMALWTTMLGLPSDDMWFEWNSRGDVDVDSSGNLFLAARAYRADSLNYYSYVYSVDPDGNAPWGSDGTGPLVTVFSGPFTGYYFGRYPQVVADQAGGAIVVWTNSNYAPGHFGQRISSDGNFLWTPGGVTLTQTSYGYAPTSISDGNGGVYVAMVAGTGYDILTTTVSASGTVGPVLTICDDPNYQWNPGAVRTSDGSVIVYWMDYRNGSSDLYAQKLSPAGIAQWATDGIRVADGTGYYINTYLGAADGLGGAVFGWIASPQSPPWYYNVFSTRIGPGGAPAWAGDPVTVARQSYVGYAGLATDGAGSAVLGWIDWRNGLGDVYAQNVDLHGYLGINTPAITSATDVPGDQGGKVRLAWERSYLDQYPSALITYYSVWRGVDPGAAPSTAAFLKPGDEPLNLTGPAFRTRTAPNGTSTAWEWIANLPAHYLATYGYTAPTPADSTAAGAAEYRYFLSAQTADPFVFWDSNIDSAHSVDNLSPAPPAALAAFAVGGTAIRLEWNRTGDKDLAGYLIYRSSEAGFTPGDETLLGQSADTTMDDSSPGLGKKYYAVVGVDVHGNLGAPSPEASSALAYGIVSSAGVNGAILPSGSVIVPAGGNQQFVITPATGYHVDSLLVDGVPVDSTQTYTFTNVSGMHTIEARFARTPALVTVSAKSGWNLVSVPLTVPDYSGSALLPTAITSPYAFSGGSYAIQSTLVNGPGYWVKFSGDQDLGMNGFDRAEESIIVEEGWNLVGSISTPVAVSSIGSDPPGIVTSQFYGYDGSYVVSPVIQPGRGYWVKAGQGGTLTLSSASGIPAAAAIRIVPSGEMPPPPPGVAGTGGAIPGNYALGENYPNPFNPVTTISYALPEAGKVRLVVYSTLGEEMATIVDAYQEAGYREVSFDASALPSGAYIYRLTAGSFTDSKRMVLIK